jgi:hypothetical protein
VGLGTAPALAGVVDQKNALIAIKVMKKIAIFHFTFHLHDSNQVLPLRKAGPGEIPARNNP